MKPLQILVFAALCGFSGCVSSPQARIDEDPALFKSYSAHQQYLIRKGQIEVRLRSGSGTACLGQSTAHTPRHQRSGHSTYLGVYRTAAPYGCFSSATIKRGLDAGVHVHGNPTRTKLRGRVFFDSPSGKVARFQSFQ